MLERTAPSVRNAGQSVAAFPLSVKRHTITTTRHRATVKRLSEISVDISVTDASDKINTSLSGLTYARSPRTRGPQIGDEILTPPPPPPPPGARIGPSPNSFAKFARGTTLIYALDPINHEFLR